MALQGTLDTFALTDVLRLLAARQQDRRLRHRREPWIGQPVGRRRAGGGRRGRPAGRTPRRRSSLFELLRFTDGDFTFDTEYQAPTPAARPTWSRCSRGRGASSASGARSRPWSSLDGRPRSRCVRAAPADDVGSTAEHWRPRRPWAAATHRGRRRRRASSSASSTSAARSRTWSRPACLQVLTEPSRRGRGERAPSRPPVRPAPASAAARLPSAPDTASSRPAAEATWPPRPVRPDARRRPELARQHGPAAAPDAARAVAGRRLGRDHRGARRRPAAIEGEVDGEPINRGLLLKFLSSVRS